MQDKNQAILSYIFRSWRQEITDRWSVSEIGDFVTHQDLFMAAARQNTAEPDTIYKDDFVFDFFEPLEQWVEWYNFNKEEKSKEAEEFLSSIEWIEEQYEKATKMLAKAKKRVDLAEERHRKIAKCIMELNRLHCEATNADVVDFSTFNIRKKEIIHKVHELINMTI